MDQTRTSETWERLRKSDQQFPGKTVWRGVSPSANETGITTGTTPRSTSATIAPGTAVGRIAAARGFSVWRVDRVRRRKTGVTAAGYSGQFSGISH